MSFCWSWRLLFFCWTTRASLLFAVWTSILIFRDILRIAIAAIPPRDFGCNSLSEQRWKSICLLDTHNSSSFRPNISLGEITALPTQVIRNYSTRVYVPVFVVGCPLLLEGEPNRQAPMVSGRVSSDDPEVEGMRRCAAYLTYAGKTTAAVEVIPAIAEVDKPGAVPAYPIR
ncbi:hypothetical protein DL98DRAFT_578825 [Cadophora sp. DSE1049]|nr:hypothetical protein DL98DRAFT_578825 [Cadophora sp. DSE1049]